ncbi:MAG: methyltransferase domain-containing protein [Chloroflexota bacterium]
MDGPGAGGRTGVSDLEYVLSTGEAGASRLELLESLYGPATEALLGELIRPGASVVDVGCGIGTVVAWLCGAVGPAGSVVGLDISADQLAVASASAAERGLANVRFVEADAYATGLPRASFDLVCCRSLLSHLEDPAAAVREMAALVRPGGVLLCEDIDMATIHADPPSATLDRVTELFFALGRVHRCDYRVGSRLADLETGAGLAAPASRADQPTLRTGEGKRYWEYTFVEVAPAMIRAGVTTPDEVGALAADLARIGTDATTAIAQPQRTQAWATKPA